MNDQDSVLKTAKMIADNGWKGTFHMLSGEKHSAMFITASDFDKGAVVCERIGERHLPPTLLMLSEVKHIVPDWS